MSVYICPRCGKIHSVGEFLESRFCRGCGHLLTYSDKIPLNEGGETNKGVSNGNDEVEGFLKLFPYTPYPQQLEFMRDAERILSIKGGVMIAEACNGFGKTVCALSVALSLGHGIIYATRTHEQVRQVLTEVERINERVERKFSAISLASRQNLCLNGMCRRLPPIEAMETCNILRKTERCPYRSEMHDPSFLDLPAVLSVRKLLRIGREYRICPYFLARRIARDSTVVVAPYPYVFNEAIRVKVKLEINDKILIFDEAHNADKIGQEALSDTMSERSLNNAARELNLINVEGEFLDELKNYLDENLQPQPIVKRGSELHQDLESIVGRNLREFAEEWEPIVEEIRLNKIRRGMVPICYLNGILNFLSLVGSGKEEGYAAIYRRTKTGLGIIEYRCLDPSLAIKPVIEKAYSTLIMSGTLSPLELFKEIIGLGEAETRTYSAIMRPENIRTYVDLSVTTRFEERSEEMLSRYGEKISELIPKIPNGVLIFFPQRGLMIRAINNWLRNGYMGRNGGKITMRGKRVFIEGEKASENAKIVDEYKRAAKSDDGAILFAVFRGRNAEGSNFPYEEARGIILIGIPYADYHDPIVRAQIAYLNKRRPRLGDLWYVMDAFRAANQAMGRGIRHIDDWCSFFLMDRRYGTHWRFISKWATENGIVKLD